jgi:hypothetical protein
MDPVPASNEHAINMQLLDLITGLEVLCWGTTHLRILKSKTLHLMSPQLNVALFLRTGLKSHAGGTQNTKYKFNACNKY